MLGLFKKLLSGHKWFVHAQRKYSKTSSKETGETYTYTLDVLICEHCGKIKQIEY